MEIKLLKCNPYHQFLAIARAAVSFLFFIVKYIFLKQFIVKLMVKYTYLLTLLTYSPPTTSIWGRG